MTGNSLKMSVMKCYSILLKSETSMWRSKNPSQCLLKHRNKAENLRLGVNLAINDKAKTLTIKQLETDMHDMMKELQMLHRSRFTVGYLDDYYRLCEPSATYASMVASRPVVRKVKPNPAVNRSKVLTAKSTANPYPISFGGKIQLELKKENGGNSSVTNNPSPSGIASVKVKEGENDKIKRNHTYTDVDFSSNWPGHPEAILSVRRPRKSTAAMRQAAHSARVKDKEEHHEAPVNKSETTNMAAPAFPRARSSLESISIKGYKKKKLPGGLKIKRNKSAIDTIRPARSCSFDDNLEGKSPQDIIEAWGNNTTIHDYNNDISSVVITGKTFSNLKI